MYIFKNLYPDIPRGGKGAYKGYSKEPYDMDHHPTEMSTRQQGRDHLSSSLEPEAPETVIRYSNHSRN